jgi:hypothetical protein
VADVSPSWTNFATIAHRDQPSQAVRAAAASTGNIDLL